MSRFPARRLAGALAVVCTAAAQASHNPPPLPDPIPGAIPTGPFTLELAEIATATDFLAFGFPIDVESPRDGTGRLFVTLKDGVVQVIDGGIVLATPFLDLSATVSGTGSDALSVIAFHPEFAQSGAPGEGKFYTAYQEPAGTGTAHFGDPVGAAEQSVVYEWQVSAANPNVADVGSKREIIRINEQVRVHNVNDLAFDDNGYLFIAKGDDDANINSILDGSTVNGTILRIDVDDTSGNGRYSIPANNPYADGTAGKLPEVYAYGFRNNWRISFDSVSGKLYVADVGEDDIEEVNVVQPGANYGWIDKEGSFAFLNFNGVTDDLTDLPADFDGIDPLAEYDHTEGERSITGGFVYRGDLIPTLRGHYVFGDLGTGRLFNLDPTTLEIQEITVDPAGEPATTGLISFGETEAGEILLVYANTGFTPTVNRIMAVVGGTGPDTDSDGVSDDTDNCRLIANGPLLPDAGGFSQRDTNGDGLGNVCDPDLDNNGSVDFGDLPLLQQSFFAQQGDPNYNADADIDGDGAVNFADLPTFQQFFFGAPGPGAP